MRWSRWREFNERIDLDILAGRGYRYPSACRPWPIRWGAAAPRWQFFRLRLWIEHQGSDLAHRLDLKPGEAALLAPHLAWHHWEHHQWPAVPYWKLPALRRLVPGEPLVTLSSLIEFYRACPPAPSGHPQRMLSDRKVA